MDDTDGVRGATTARELTLTRSDPLDRANSIYQLYRMATRWIGVRSRPRRRLCHLLGLLRDR